jgi:alcohol dehydrogenase YqhD (iron-dependent ADH family)
MVNFTAHNPTKVIFGKDVVKQLGTEAVKYGNRALVLIGQGSVKKNGLLDLVLAQLEKMGITPTLFEGIRPNPIYQDCDKAVQVALEAKAEMIIAIGGGSVLDSAKAIAMGYYVNHSVWDFYTQKASKPASALPILAVLTLAATGSEMNPYTVIQDTENGLKVGYGSPLLYPKVSFLDPSYTFSVSPKQTAYGVADLISHCLEEFFEPTDSPLSDHIASDIIKLAFQYGRQAVAEPENYEARSQVMWLATMALNGSLTAGKYGGDWGVHALEHSLSVLFDIAHGAGLSIAYPAWIKYHQTQVSTKLDFLAERVLGKGHTGEQFISALEAFYTEIGTPTRLSQASIGADKHASIIDNWTKSQASGGFFKLTGKDYPALLELMQ